MKTIGSRLAAIILALAIAMALGACSALKLGYSTLPDVAYWWLDGYVDFNDAQKPVVHGELAALQAWHRQQELPRFVQLFARLEQMVPGAISPQQACGVVSEVQERLVAVSDRAEPTVTALVATLTPDQLQHIERKYRRNNEAFTKDWIQPEPDKVKEKRFAQFLDRLETLYGRLDEPQRRVLREAIAQSSYDPQRVLAERQRRQQDLLQTLGRMTAGDTPADDKRALLHAYLQRVQHSPDLAYRNWQDALLQEECRTFSAVHESTTATQRAHAASTLRGWQADFRALAESH